jgi:FtsZ-binding cell division protein ZapB
MSTLARFKKKGGFGQLLQLIETSGTQKREKFLSLIEAEDPRWANAVREKSISMEMILSTNQNTLAEIFSRIRELTIATAAHGFGVSRLTPILPLLNPAQRRQIQEIYDSKKPTEAEINSCYISILTEVRKLIDSQTIKAESLSPGLKIEEGYEEKLIAGTMVGPSVSVDTSDVEALQVENTKEGFEKLTQENYNLRLKIKALTKENEVLRQQTTELIAKIEKIVKIAS